MMRAIKINKIFKAVFDEFVYGGHMLAFGLACILTLSAILLNIQITWDFLVIIYLFTLSACLFGRYLDLNEDVSTNPERSVYLNQKSKKIPIKISLSVLLSAVILLYFGKYFVFALCIVLVLLSFSYDFFIKKFTRKIVGLKNIFISALFASLLLLLVVYYNLSINFAFVLVLSFIFLRIFIGTSFSDIKDIDSDKKEGLKTFPVVLERSRLFQFLSFINILSGVPIVVGVILGVLPEFSLFLLFAIFYSFFYFFESYKKRISDNILYNVIVDSELILWLAFVLIGRAILLI